MSDEKQLRNRRLSNNEKTGETSLGKCGGDSKYENITKNNMEEDKRSCLRRRGFRDTGSAAPHSQHRADVSGRGKAKADSSEEAEDGVDVQIVPVKSQGGEDEASTSGLPAKRRRITRHVEESLLGEKDVEEGDEKRKGKKKGRGRKRFSKKSKPKKSTTSKKARGNEGKFEVEKILNVKVLKNGKREFLIRWKGFSAEYDTWEPESNLDCKDLVKEYFEEQKEVINASDEDTNENKTRTGESSQSSRSKAADSAAEAETTESEGIKKGRRTVKRTSGNRKRSGTRGRKPRAAGMKRRPDEAVRTDTRKADEGNIDVAEESEDKEAKDIFQPSTSAEVVSGPSGVAGKEDSKEYEVERILDVRQLKDGTRQFLIKWRGFAKKYNTWEPESNMNCTVKIQKFLKRLEEKATERELRVDRKKTSRFTIDDEKRGRKMSLRLGKMPRKSYAELD